MGLLLAGAAVRVSDERRGCQTGTGNPPDIDLARTDTLSAMTAKERVLAEAPAWTEEQAEAALRAAEGNGQTEPEMAELPETWKRFDDGTPVPNWVALLERSRQGH